MMVIMKLGKFSIRKAKLDEADQLSNIAINSKGYWGYDEKFLRKCKPYLTITKRDIEETPVYIIASAESILGFYQLRPLNEVEIDLVMFFIDPKHVKKNLGKKLIEHSKEISRELGFKTLIIESDPNSKGFYEKYGGKFKGYAKSEVLEERMLPVYVISL